MFKRLTSTPSTQYPLPNAIQLFNYASKTFSLKLCLARFDGDACYEYFHLLLFTYYVLYWFVIVRYNVYVCVKKPEKFSFQLLVCNAMSNQHARNFHVQILFLFSWMNTNSLVSLRRCWHYDKMVLCVRIGCAMIETILTIEVRQQRFISTNIR